MLCATKLRDKPERTAARKSETRRTWSNFRDLTKTRPRQLDPLVDGSRIERVIQFLLPAHKNILYLIGEPGVGQTAIFEGWRKNHSRRRSFISGNKRILSLDLSRCCAQRYRGQLKSA